MDELQQAGPPVGSIVLSISLDSIPGPHNHYYALRAEKWRVQPDGSLAREPDHEHQRITWKLDYDSTATVKDIILRHLGSAIGERLSLELPRLDTAQHLKPARAYLGGTVEELDIRVEPA